MARPLPCASRDRRPPRARPRDMKILLTDDHVLVRQGLKLILADHFPNTVFGEASNAHEAFRLVAKEKWDVVVLDVSMPGRNGLDVLREIRRLCPKLPVLILSMHPEDQFAVRLLKIGAVGYLTKESAGEELVGAIRKVTSGGRYVSPRLAERMAAYLDINVKQAPHERLSDREFLILRLIASGKTVGQIAKELSLSVSTVSTYRSRILSKMNLKNNAQLTSYAVQNRLVD